MYRKIMGFLEAWKESKHRKPLILQGARQVGLDNSCYTLLYIQIIPEQSEPFFRR